MSQSHTPPPAAIRALPIGETARLAYATVFGQIGLVFKAAVFPFVLSMLLVGLATSVPPTGFLSGLFLILSFVPYTLFGVAWHRVSLLGPAAAAPQVIPAWRRRHFRFLVYAVGVMLILYVLSIPVFALTVTAAAGALIGALGALALFALMLRLSFVFPAIAVDEQYGLNHSWAHTKGQTLRLLAVMALVALPMMVLFALVVSAFGDYLFADLGAFAEGDQPPSQEEIETFMSDNAVPIIFSQMLVAAINYLLMALTVSAISIAFRFCTGWVPGAPVPGGPGGGTLPDRTDDEDDGGP